MLQRIFLVARFDAAYWEHLSACFEAESTRRSCLRAGAGRVLRFWDIRIEANRSRTPLRVGNEAHFLSMGTRKDIPPCPGNTLYLDEKFLSFRKIFRILSCPE